MSRKKIILFGIGIWAFVFIVAMVMFPLRDNQRPLFESIVPVALTLAVTWASLRYFRDTEQKSLAAGFRLGLVWVGVSLILDLLLFSWGPMKMSLVDYIKDIGVTYMMIPIIVSGFGYMYEQKNKINH